MKHNLKTVVAKISFPEECVDCLETRMEIDKLVKELQQLKDIGYLKPLAEELYDYVGDEVFTVDFFLKLLLKWFQKHIDEVLGEG